MTDTLIEQIKADAEKGTPGEWQFIADDWNYCLQMPRHSEWPNQMHNEKYYPGVPENEADWRRIARVPEMEARILADAEEKARLHNTIAKLRGAEMKAQTIALSANQHSDFSEEENKALRKALEFYADPKNWESGGFTNPEPGVLEFGMSSINKDGGQVACTALTSIGDSDE